MYSKPTTYYLINGILQAENESKQNLGNRFVDILQLTRGSGGSVAGIDGSTVLEGINIHFQSNLSTIILKNNKAQNNIRYNKN